MSAKLLDGKTTSLAIKSSLKNKVEKFVVEGKRAPHLVAVLVGNDGGSLTYVNAKVKACKEVGFNSTLIHFDEQVSQEVLLNKVESLNNDENVDGFIVQLPLPKHINEKTVTLTIDPLKDVDGFHPVNIGKMSLNLPCFLPATPNGVLELLKEYEIPTEGKHCVIIGRSAIVGTPLSILLSRNRNPGNATVTLTHSRTKNLKEITQNADILISAIGKPAFIKADMIKNGAVVIDVGISRVEDLSKKSGYKLYGDIDFESVSQKASFLTPVPGGVGPMTIVSLLQNTFQAYQNKSVNF
tara:strand:+ start:602 stop:1492 length:891 start_codon:yes stop_codon:yes gene_type:complete